MRWRHRDRASTSETNGAPAPVARNIDQLIARHESEKARRTWQVRVADAITVFAGSMLFVWLHVAWFGVWIVVNLGLVPGLPVFDEFPFGLLTMVVSLEAIFLSTFVLVSQNRMQAVADRRADLDLHVNLLAELETTEILKKLVRIEQQLGIPMQPGEEEVLRELTQETDPVAVVDELERKLEDAEQQCAEDDESQRDAPAA